MNKINGVVAAVCVTFDDEDTLGIVAFVVTDTDLSFLDIRRAASKLLPENMLPDRIEQVDALPLNKSNQLDEHQLLVSAGLKPFRPTAARPSSPT
jgi:acyl-coenzyme A synthetase/AMP-(fatty) acid ligase